MLLSLDVTKAMGLDDLSPRILKECADVLSPLLCDIFKKSLLSGSVPSGFNRLISFPSIRELSYKLSSSFSFVLCQQADGELPT